MTALGRSRLSRRGVLALGTTAALGATLAGCDENSALPAATSDDQARATGGGRVSLAQWYHQYDEDGTREAVEGYAADYPGADVTVTWTAGDYDEATAAALATDAGPDVFEYPNGPTIDMINRGQVADLTDVFGDALADFTPALIDRMTYDGKIWAIPQVLDLQLLVYRRSLLEAAGIDPPQQMVDLVAAAKELTRGQVKGLFLGADAGASVMGGPMLWAAGLDYLDDDQVGFQAAGAAEALTVLRTLATDGSLLLEEETDWSDPTALTSGRAAMQWTGLWTFAQIERSLGDDFGAIPWPSLEGGMPSVALGAYGSCVSTRAKDVDAARAFASWLWVDQKDKQLDFATSYGVHVPARLSLVPQADVLSSGPAADAAGYVQDYGHAQAPLLWTRTCADAWEAMMGRIVGAGADAQTELEALVPVVEAELERVTA